MRWNKFSPFMSSKTIYFSNQHRLQSIVMHNFHFLFAICSGDQAALRCGSWIYFQTIFVTLNSNKWIKSVKGSIYHGALLDGEFCSSWVKLYEEATKSSAKNGVPECIIGVWNHRSSLARDRPFHDKSLLLFSYGFKEQAFTFSFFTFR